MKQKENKTKNLIKQTTMNIFSTYYIIKISSELELKSYFHKLK